MRSFREIRMGHQKVTPCWPNHDYALMPWTGLIPAFILPSCFTIFLHDASLVDFVVPNWQMLSPYFQSQCFTVAWLLWGGGQDRLYNPIFIWLKLDNFHNSYTHVILNLYHFLQKNMFWKMLVKPHCSSLTYMDTKPLFWRHFLKYFMFHRKKRD